jgi:hypothetical protein
VLLCIVPPTLRVSTSPYKNNHQDRHNSDGAEYGWPKALVCGSGEAIGRTCCGIERVVVDKDPLPAFEFVRRNLPTAIWLPIDGEFVPESILVCSLVCANDSVVVCSRPAIARSETAE